jgi:hypothetical protein
MFDDENELTEEEKKEKPMHLVVVLPNDKEKEFNEVKLDILKKILLMVLLIGNLLIEYLEATENKFKYHPTSVVITFK